MTPDDETLPDIKLAIHETGHATAAYALAVPLLDLSTGRSGGVTRVYGIGGVDLERRLWVTLAGPAADHEFILGVTRWNRIDDVVEVDDLCRQLRVSPDPIFSRLQELLRANRPAIDALASELDEKHRLDHKEAEAILSQHLTYGGWLPEVRDWIVKKESLP